MNYLNPHWLKEKFSTWTDDQLHDRYREICAFGGADTLKHMIEMESKRRQEQHEEERKMFQVTNKCCSQCLFGPNKIVSESKKKSLIKEITREQSYFVCHKATIEGKETCCRGFYETMGVHSQIIRIAERLGAIEFVEEARSTCSKRYVTES